MNALTNNRLTSAALIALALALPAGQAAAAGFVKYDGIDGEARQRPTPTKPAGPARLKAEQKGQSTGLLLPAIQKARDTEANRKPKANAVKPKSPKPRGLLLPAIQKARGSEAGPKSKPDAVKPNPTKSRGLLLPAIQKAR